MLRGGKVTLDYETFRRLDTRARVRAWGLSWKRPVSPV